MAALNTLRTKGGVVVAVVIAISLLAFLLGDLTSNGNSLFNSSKMSVGEINGKSISYNDYLEKVNYLTEVQRIISGQESINEQQSEAVKVSAWEQTAIENSFDESFENLGMIISDTELVDMADGEYISPVLLQFFTNQEYGLYDYNAVRSFVANLDQDQTGRSRFLWNYMETEMLTERLRSKYLTLIQKSVFANNIEVENAVKNADTSYDISYVGKSLTTIADSTINITEADYKKYYDEHKRLFKQVESRDIEYVVFDALPSSSDYAEAAKEANTLASELATAENVEQFVNLNSDSKYVDAYYSAAELSSSLRDFAMNSAKNDIYGPVLESDVYTIARFLDNKMLPDSVGFRQIIFAQGTDLIADSVLTAIKGKKLSFNDAVVQFSLDKQTPGGNVGTIALNGLVGIGDMYTKIGSSKKGDIFKVNTPYGIAIVETTHIGEIVKKSKLAIVSYTVEPSERTMRDSYTQATEFANSAKADFNKAVEAGAYSKRVARLNAGESNVSGIDKSQEIVRWAFNNKTGDVSEIIAVGESNIVVRVSSATEHGYLPLNSIKSSIKTALLREKKVAALTAEISGSSLEEVASNLGAEIKTVSDANFNSYYIPELGVALNVIGAMTTLPENTLSKPVPTSTEVIVFKVDEAKVSEVSTFEAQKVVTQTTMETDVYSRVFSAVFDLADIKDSRIKFF
ncbi:MAG: SurA N-terminal domain-containing protein [Rikenellaceae bacterium]